MIPFEEIEQRVKATLAEALNVDEEDIQPESTIQGDLAAESIDFLDIVFRLEREFGIKIPRLSIFPEHMISDVFDGDSRYFDSNKGIITKEGITLLLENFPDVDIKALGDPPKTCNLPDLFTAGYVVRYVYRRLRK